MFFFKLISYLRFFVIYEKFIYKKKIYSIKNIRYKMSCGHHYESSSCGCKPEPKPCCKPAPKPCCKPKYCGCCPPPKSCCKPCCPPPPCKTYCNPCNPYNTYTYWHKQSR